MDDLNNRLRAGILDLRSLAAGLKEEEKASAERRAQDAQQLAEGETSPRGPEVTPRHAPRSPPRPPTLPTPPSALTSLTSAPAQAAPCHLHLCHFDSCPSVTRATSPQHDSARCALHYQHMLRLEVPCRAAVCTLHSARLPPSCFAATPRLPPSSHLRAAVGC